MNTFFTTATFSARLADGTFRSTSVPAVATREELECALLSNCNTYSGAFRATLSGGVVGKSFLQAVLLAGWKDINYLWEDGQWFVCEGLVAGQRRPLGPQPAADASSEQRQLVYRVTKSHVFDDDRLILRHSADNATEEECSALIDWMLKEVKSRKDAEKSCLRAA